MTDRPEYDHPDGVDPDIWEQELAGEGAMHAVFVLARRRLRELEQSEGFNQSKLAARMGLTRTQVSRWFASPSNMTLRNAAKMLMAMGRRLEFSISDPYAVAMSAPLSQPIAPAVAATVIDFAAARAARDAASHNPPGKIMRAQGASDWRLAAKAGDQPDGVGTEPQSQAKIPRWLGEIKSNNGIVECYSLDEAVIVRIDASSVLNMLHLDDRSYELAAVAGHPGAFHVDGLTPPVCVRLIEKIKTSPTAHRCSWD